MKLWVKSFQNEIITAIKFAKKEGNNVIKLTEDEVVRNIQQIRLNTIGDIRQTSHEVKEAVKSNRKATMDSVDGSLTPIFLDRDLSNGSINHYVMFFVVNLNDEEHKYMADLAIRERQFKEGRVIIAQKSVDRHDERLLKLGISRNTLTDASQQVLALDAI